MWGPGRKMAFGAAPGPKSKLWYTLAEGSLSEVFFPQLDRVALHELRFFASAGGAPPVDDSTDGDHSISWLAPGIPAFSVDSTHHEYRLTKDFFSDPEENAMFIAANFSPELPDVRLYMQASAHWQPGTEGNFASVIDTNPPALLIRQQDVWICIVGPFSRGTVGYYRSSDLQVDLHDGDGYLTSSYDRGGPGNVTVGAEIGSRKTNASNFRMRQASPSGKDIVGDEIIESVRLETREGPAGRELLACFQRLLQARAGRHRHPGGPRPREQRDGGRPGRQADPGRHPQGRGRPQHPGLAAHR